MEAKQLRHSHDFLPHQWQYEGQFFFDLLYGTMGQQLSLFIFFGHNSYIFLGCAQKYFPKEKTDFSSN